MVYSAVDDSQIGLFYKYEEELGSIYGDYYIPAIQYGSDGVVETQDYTNGLEVFPLGTFDLNEWDPDNFIS